jgi:hypothetical protein
MKKYEKLMAAVKHNLWAKSLNVSSQYSPNVFTGIRYEYKQPKKKTFLSQLKNLIK